MFYLAKMARKERSFEIDIVGKRGFFQKFSGDKEDFDFEGLALFRRLISNEKARLLTTIKKRKPKSIYELAKFLQRDFKSVAEDIKLLEKFDLVDMIEEKTGKRNRLKPILTASSLNVRIHL